jgi:lysozyme
MGAYADVTECPASVVEGVDVSDTQGPVTWSSVKSSGRAFAFVKATQGTYNTNVTFAANWANIQTAGLLRSPYHFFDATIDGIAQANYFLATINNAGGLQPGDLPPMLDLQCPTSSNQTMTELNCEYTGDSGWVDTSTLSQRVFDWLNTVEAATGRKPIIYSYSSWFADVGFTDANLANYPLYIATYGSCASVPPPWITTTFWQYSAAGSVPGISGDADLDRFVGSQSALQVFVDTIFADGFDQ